MTAHITASIMLKFKIFSSLHFPRIKFDTSSLCIKCPFGSFFWSVFSHIWTKYGEKRNTGKCGPEKATYLNIILTVISLYSDQF